MRDLKSVQRQFFGIEGKPIGKDVSGRAWNTLKKQTIQSDQILNIAAQSIDPFQNRFSGARLGSYDAKGPRRRDTQEQ